MSVIKIVQKNIIIQKQCLITNKILSIYYNLQSLFTDYIP